MQSSPAPSRRPRKPTLAERGANLAALWRDVLAARASFNADPTRENAARLADARQAWRDAE